MNSMTPPQRIAPGCECDPPSIVDSQFADAITDKARYAATEYARLKRLIEDLPEEQLAGIRNRVGQHSDEEICAPGVLRPFRDRRILLAHVDRQARRIRELQERLDSQGTQPERRTVPSPQQ